MIDRYTRAILTVIALALVALVARPLWAPAPAQGAESAKTGVRVIEAERFILRDSQGRIRATLGVHGGDAPALEIYDEDGRIRAEFGIPVPMGLPVLSFYGRDGWSVWNAP